VQEMGWPILTIYTSYDMFCASSCLLGVTVIAPALKCLVVLIF